MQRNIPIAIHRLANRQGQLNNVDPLAKRAIAGDLRAFNDLVIKHQDAVYRQAYWIIGDEAAAEDAAQEAFYRAYTKFHTFNGESFRAWILRIATNYCLDTLRKQKSHPTVPLEPWNPEDAEENENCAWLVDDQFTPEQQVERLEMKATIERSLQKLSPEDRIAIILVDLQEMNYQEAADLLRIPIGTFKSRLSRARVRLVNILRPYL